MTLRGNTLIMKEKIANQRDLFHNFKKLYTNLPGSQHLMAVPIDINVPKVPPP